MGADCPLTTRQLEVMGLVMEGLSMGAIAHAMGVSESTVRSHIHESRERLGLVGEGRNALFTTMLANGWASPQWRSVPRDAYATWLQAASDEREWRPSAAQRCYLTAFTTALWRRDVRALYVLELAFRLMCMEAGVWWERQVFDAERAAVKFDAMLLKLARGVQRQIPV